MMGDHNMKYSHGIWSFGQIGIHLNVQTKGSLMFIRSKKIIITSNYSIEQCSKNKENVKTFKRKLLILQSLNSDMLMCKKS